MPALLLLRLLLALAALAGLSMLVGRDLLPNVSAATWVAIGVAAVLALVVLVALGAWVLGTLGQWLLRHGAEDSSWGWFGAAARHLPPRRRRE